VPGTQNNQAVRLPMRLVISISVLAALTAPAIAQNANAAMAGLRKDVPCASASAARPAIEGNISKSTSPAADIDAALAAIAADGSICSALRDAAKDIGATRAAGTTTTAAADPAAAPAAIGDMPASSREAVAAALAEGERRVANLKFEVGPPPPNLTKGHNPGR
jgi:hypothetical protein